jgi:hypothetical protein
MPTQRSEEGVVRVSVAPYAHPFVVRQRMLRTLALSLCLFTTTAIAAEPVFDVHVHLRDGETSLREYRETVRAAGLELSGMGVMWFGGPHQARQGDLAKIRAGNDRVIALAAAHADVLPIATVHPYDGDAALAELARVAAAGVKVLKIHARASTSPTRAWKRSCARPANSASPC